MARVLSMANATARQSAAGLLAAGRVVVFPTDTVYGLGALPTPTAVRALYVVKGRPATKPIPLLLANAVELDRYAPEPGELAHVLVDGFWPGPLTIVLRAGPEIALAVGSPDGTVGFRVPAHEHLRNLIALCGGALAVTSANRSGEPETRSATEARRQLGDQVAMVLDGGDSGFSHPSTIIAVRGTEIIILRDGTLSEQIRAFASARGMTVRPPGTVEVSR